jgi:hypothetical protein
MTTAPELETAARPREFYDSAEWPEHPPAGSWAMLYRDGVFARFQHADMFERVRWITVTGDYRTCGAADWLPDNRFDLARYVAGRQEMQARARAYVARVAARHALDVLGYPHRGQLWTYPGLKWWLPTLDDVLRTPDELAADLRANWDAPIAPEDIWAQQYRQYPQLGKGAAFDVSRLFLPW